MPEERTCTSADERAGKHQCPCASAPFLCLVKFSLLCCLYCCCTIFHQGIAILDVLAFLIDGPYFSGLCQRQPLDEECKEDANKPGPSQVESVIRPNLRGVNDHTCNNGHHAKQVRNERTRGGKPPDEFPRSLVYLPDGDGVHVHAPSIP